jgi:hypothetical protein
MRSSKRSAAKQSGKATVSTAKQQEAAEEQRRDDTGWRHTVDPMLKERDEVYTRIQEIILTQRGLRSETHNRNHADPLDTAGFHFPHVARSLFVFFVAKNLDLEIRKSGSLDIMAEPPSDHPYLARCGGGDCYHAVF